MIRADGTAPPVRPGSVDRVLLDAPCTGLGALRRRPEARWRRRESDLTELTRLQRALLRSALATVRPGGVVGYVVCSPHPAETRDVLADVLADGTAEQLDARPLFAGVPDLGAGPYVQLWPHRHGTDAMFCALLRRRQEGWDALHRPGRRSGSRPRNGPAAAPAPVGCVPCRRPPR